MKNLKLSIILLATTVFAGTTYGLLGCNSSGTVSSPLKVITPTTTGSLQLNAMVPVKALNNKLSTKATALEIVDYVNFTVTGDNVVGTIFQSVPFVDFVTALTLDPHDPFTTVRADTAAAAIRINNLFPGSVDVTVEAFATDTSLIANATLLAIPIVAGQLTTRWLDPLYNNLADLGVGFSWLIPSPYPTATPMAIPTADGISAR